MASYDPKLKLMYEKVNPEILNLGKDTVLDFYNRKRMVIDENFWEDTCSKLISRNNIYGTELNDNNSKILESRNSWEVEENFHRIKPFDEENALLNLANELQKTFEVESNRVFKYESAKTKTFGISQHNKEQELKVIKSLFDSGRLENILINFSLAYTDDNEINTNDKLYFYDYKLSTTYKSKFHPYGEGENAYIEV